MTVRNALWISIAGALAIAAAACGANDAQSAGIDDADAAGMDATDRQNDAVAGGAGADDMQQYGMTRNEAEERASAPASQERGSASSGGSQQVEIVDAAGFGQPMTAATMQVPAGWRTRGGVSWNRASNCISNQLQIAWAAASADGAQAFEIMPGHNWQVQGTQIQMNPCPVAPFRSTREFLQAVAQQNRPGARVLEYRDRPDIAQKAAASAQSHPQAQVRQDAGQLLIAYRQGGQDIREVLGTTVAFSQMQGNIVGGTSMVFAQRAPSGRLDFGLGERIAASMQVNPQWLAVMRETASNAERRYSSNQRQQISDWHAREMAAISARGEADRAAIRSQTTREVGQIYSQINANTAATNDTIHRQNLEGIGEYNTYADPAYGRDVRSSIHGGDRVLRQADGTYISTDDPYHDPAGSQELERVP